MNVLQEIAAGADKGFQDTLLMNFFTKFDGEPDFRGFLPILLS
jgi:hypothetical protein